MTAVVMKLPVHLEEVRSLICTNNERANLNSILNLDTILGVKRKCSEIDVSVPLTEEVEGFRLSITEIVNCKIDNLSSHVGVDPATGIQAGDKSVIQRINEVHDLVMGNGTSLQDADSAPQSSFLGMSRKLGQDMNALMGTMNEMTEAMKAIAEDVKSMKSDITNMKSDITNMKSDIAILKSDNETLKLGQAASFNAFCRAYNAGVELSAPLMMPVKASLATDESNIVVGTAYNASFTGQDLLFLSVAELDALNLHYCISGYPLEGGHHAKRDAVKHFFGLSSTPPTAPADGAGGSSSCVTGRGHRNKASRA